MVQPQNEEMRLVEQARAGDADAFGAVAHRFYPVLLTVALRIVRNVEDARDVVQEALLNAYRHLGDYRQEARFSTWLARITINQALTFRRSRKATLVSLEDQYGPVALTAVGWLREANTPETLYGSKELESMIRQVIDRMPRPYKAVMRLKSKDLDDREIAGTLGLSLAAVKLRLHRARRSLRGILAARLREWQRPSTRHAQVHETLSLPPLSTAN